MSNVKICQASPPHTLFATVTIILSIYIQRFVISPELYYWIPDPLLDIHMNYAGPING